MKVYEGTILTVDAHDSVARFLVEDSGTIVFVGNELPELYSHIEREVLNDGALCPAFVDTHEHLASFAMLCKRDLMLRLCRWSPNSLKRVPLKLS